MEPIATEITHGIHSWTGTIANVAFFDTILLHGFVAQIVSYATKSTQTTCRGIDCQRAQHNTAAYTLIAHSTTDWFFFPQRRMYFPRQRIGAVGINIKCVLNINKFYKQNRRIHQLD
jgi:hypothetical protein